MNHRIKCQDKIRSPGAREKKHLLREQEDDVAFSVVWDMAKAHRRHKHDPMQQVDTTEEVPGDPAAQTVR